MMHCLTKKKKKKVTPKKGLLALIHCFNKHLQWWIKIWILADPCVKTMFPEPLFQNPMNPSIVILEYAIREDVITWSFRMLISFFRHIHPFSTSRVVPGCPAFALLQPRQTELITVYFWNSLLLQTKMYWDNVNAT